MFGEEGPYTKVITWLKSTEVYASYDYFKPF